MKRLIPLFVIIAILIAAGGLTAMFAATNGTQMMPGAKIQTANPEASAFLAPDWQAQQFVLLVGFIIFNLIGMGVTIAIVVWLLSRQVAIAKASDSPASTDQAAIQTAE